MLKLYNTLTRKIEEFTPLNLNLVTVYTCGPTVYDYAQIGNFRTYTMADFLVRTLKRFGYKTKYVMNVTDVGHLVSDADSGEDKLEKGARRERKTAWEIAKFYTDAFLIDSKKLNLLEPDVRPKPTEHIPEQIEMIKILLKKSFAYQIDDGIYFDTSQFPSYGELTGQKLEELKEGARVEPNLQKRNSTDFALWKFSYPQGRALSSKRDMEWPSPWGIGFPGWHIECSAMSRKYLGDQIDIHVGGADLIPIHHTNEIAQSEAAIGKHPFVRYWMHGQFLRVDGEKMSKSKNNFYRLADVENRGFNPLSLRYFYMTAHYRKPLNFTWEALSTARNSLHELWRQISNFLPRRQAGKFQISKRTILSEEKLKSVDELRVKFDAAIYDDLNMPEALAVVWETVKSNIPSPDKYDLLMDFDEVLGLNLTQKSKVKSQKLEIPNEIMNFIKRREELRNEEKFKEADNLRLEIEAAGFEIEDTSGGPKVKKING